MKNMGMVVVAAGLAMTAAYYFGAQSVGYAQAGDACRYTVHGVTGDATMRSYLNVGLDAASPYGESTPDLHSFLRMNVSALDSGCDAVSVERMVIVMTASDNANSGWVRRAGRAGITLEDVDTGDIVATGVPSRIRNNEVRFYVEPFYLMSGETRTLDVYVDANGASADLDDSVQVQVAENGLTWSDERRTVREMNSAVVGAPIFF